MGRVGGGVGSAPPGVLVRASWVARDGAACVVAVVTPVALARAVLLLYYMRGEATLLDC